MTKFVGTVTLNPVQTQTVTTHEAKTHLSRYLAAVEAGEEIIIAGGRKPVARLVPFATGQEK